MSPSMTHWAMSLTLLDLSGKVFACYRYTAFGEEETHGNLLNPWRFASKRADPETGFIHFGRRYYLPAVGRWLTPDPLWFADGPNLYAYVHNHPLAYTDPDGQFAFFLIPLAISLAAEYLLPTAAVYMSEYAGGALAASFVMGMASGYSDTVSTVFDGGTYSLGEADLSSFVCSRTGMIVGAAIAALPTSRGAKLTTTAGNMALSHVSGSVVAQGEKALARQVTNYAKTSATQKTTQVAEKYFVNRRMPSLDRLSKAGQVMDREGLTKAGRGLQKHGSRPGSVFPKLNGSITRINQHGQYIVEDIITHPNSVIHFRTHKQFGEIIDVKVPNIGGVRFTRNCDMIGLLEP